MRIRGLGEKLQDVAWDVAGAAFMVILAGCVLVAMTVGYLRSQD